MGFLHLNIVFVVVVVVTQPLQREGAWRKTIKLGNSPGPGPEVVKRHSVAKERAAQKVRSWTVQNEMERCPGASVPRRCMKANPILER